MLIILLTILLIILSIGEKGLEYSRPLVEKIEGDLGMAIAASRMPIYGLVFATL